MGPSGCDGMMPPREPAACSLFAALLLTTGLLLLLPPAAAVTIEPGVVFQPSLSWANITFASAQVFSTVHVDPTGVTFDAVRLGVQKFPLSYPRIEMTLTAWSPGQSAVGGTVLRFTGDAPPASNFYFGLSDLIPAAEYILDLDGLEEARRFSDAGGNLSFSWANWSVHDFHIRRGSRFGLPGPSPLVADFTLSPSSPVIGQTVSFAASVAGGTPPYTVTWDFGDGSSAGGQSTSHVFAIAGTFSVNAFVVDSASQSTAASRTVDVADVPIPPTPLTADFTFAPARPSASQAVSFAASAAGGTSPYAFAWDFGDGGTGTGSPTAYTYALPGSYVVTLNVSDAGSDAFLVAKAITVTAAAIRANVTAAFDHAVSGSTISFTDRSVSDSGLPIASWFWAFGDRTSSRESDPVHTYPVPGFVETYRVDLIACDSQGNCGAASVLLTFYNWPLILGTAGLGGLVLGGIGVAIRRRRKRRRLSTSPMDDRQRAP